MSNPTTSTIISAMDKLISRPRVFPGPSARPALLAGVSGCLLLAMWTSDRVGAGLPPFIDPTVLGMAHGPAWEFVLVPIVATVAGLCMLRWWPYLLVVSGLLAVPGVLSETIGLSYPHEIDYLFNAGYPLAVVGVLACAQGLMREAPGWGAVVAGLTMGARLFGSALVGAAWLTSTKALPAWHAVLIVVGLAGLLPAMWWKWRGDPAATGTSDSGRWSWRKVRPAVTGGLAVCLALPLSCLTTERLAALLGITWYELYRYRYVEIAIVGAITLVIATVLATLAGLWSLAGTLTAATVHVATVAPMILVIAALDVARPVLWLGALAGVVLGAVAARVRWRIPLAGTLTVLAATVLFIAYGATTGHPEKLADQHSTVPVLLILVMVTAAATAVVGATAPTLAPHGTLPAVLGPLAGVMAAGGVQTVKVTYLSGGTPVSSYLNPVLHLTTSAVLLLIAGAAIGGLGLARQLAARRAERKHTEQVRREAAAAERDRLARPIHDGVLQVLALVRRHGPELGEQGSQLAALAGEQEVALRSLLSGGATIRPGATNDLRRSLLALASPAIEVAAPAEPIIMSALIASEMTAAVKAALDNVRRHAGPSARVWVLLEDESDGVRVTVRDDGIGFAPERLAEAEASGRLGVAQSIRGRVTALGGTATICSSPGEGAEVEMWVPRRSRRAV